jgi:2'-5' RNA ligase
MLDTLQTVSMLKFVSLFVESSEQRVKAGFQDGHDRISTMRLFTGIDIAPNVLDKIERLLGELRPLAKLNWSPVENLHITTKFIGEWPESRIPELKQTLESIPPPQNFAISIAHFGFFPNPHHPRVLFAGVRAPKSLPSLARSTEDALVPLGIAREERAYSPHLTLAKIKNEDIRALREHIASMTNFDFGSFDATEFHLYLSKPGPRGSVYTKLATYSLSGAAAVPETRASRG